MPEADSSETKQFHEDVPQRSEVFFLKGSAAYDWGMQNRLARIFRPESGRTVMLAIDHGYFQGPTTGLERVDLNILPLVPYADALMLHPGHPALASSRRRSSRASSSGRAAARASSRSSRTSRSRSTSTTPCGWAPSAMAVQVFVGGEFETQSVHNMTRLVDEGYRRGIPVLGRDRRRQGARPRRALPRAWRPGSAPSSAPRSSRPTTARRASSRSPPAARSRSSWPAARSCPSSTR